MSERDEWNRKIIDEFRSNAGVVGGQFEGVSILLLHHRGARTGTDSTYAVYSSQKAWA